VADGQVELREDLVSSCVVGDVITVLGLVKVLATGDAKPAGVAAGSAATLHNSRGSLWALPVSLDPLCSVIGALQPHSIHCLDRTRSDGRARNALTRSVAAIVSDMQAYP
jgi:hypothetical protein